MGKGSASSHSPLTTQVALEASRIQQGFSAAVQRYYSAQIVLGHTLVCQPTISTPVLHAGYTQITIDRLHREEHVDI